MSKVIKRFIVPCLLSLCIIFNGANFRRDVQAFVPAVVAGWVVVALCATALGIYQSKLHSTEEYKAWCNDFSEWITENNKANMEDFVRSYAPGMLVTTAQGLSLFMSLYKEWSQTDLYKSKYGDITSPAYSSGINSFDDIRHSFYEFEQNMAKTHLNYEFDESTRELNYYSIPTSFYSFKYFRFFYVIKNENDTSHGSFCRSEKLIVFSCLAYNDDNSYAKAGNIITYGGDSHLQCYGSETLYGLSDDTYNQYTNYGSVVAPLNYALCEFEECGYYINENFVDGENQPDLVTPDTTSPVELATDNALTNNNYITNVVNNYNTIVNDDGSTSIPLYYPAYQDTGNVIDDRVNGLTAPDVLTGTEGVTGVIPDMVENITDVPTGTQVVQISNITDIAKAVAVGINYGDGNVDTDKFKMKKDLTNVFPFCIPFDLIRVYQALSTNNSVCPVFSFDFSNLPVFKDVPSKYSDNLKYTLDMSKYNDFIRVEKVFVFLSFCLFLIVKTRDLLRG